MESNHGKSLRFSKADIPNKTPEASAFYAVLTKSPQTPLWIVMASGPFSKSNAVGFEIPSVPFLENYESLTFGTRNRWEVIWLGVDNKSSPLTPVSDMSLFEVATHASRSSIDF